MILRGMLAKMGAASLPALRASAHNLVRRLFDLKRLHLQLERLDHGIRSSRSDSSSHKVECVLHVSAVLVLLLEAVGKHLGQGAAHGVPRDNEPSTGGEFRYCPLFPLIGIHQMLELKGVASMRAPIQADPEPAPI